MCVQYLSLVRSTRSTLPFALFISSSLGSQIGGGVMMSSFALGSFYD